MAINFYPRLSLTGGVAGSLDNLDGADLADLDIAMVGQGTNAKFYILDDDGAAGEASPGIIVPDDNPGTKNWILLNPWVAKLEAALDADNQNITNVDIDSGDINSAVTINITDVGGLIAATTVNAAFQENRALIDTNVTHISSDGTDHANVVTNDTHVAGDGSDHGDVATNTTHIGSDGSDHTFLDQSVVIGASPILAAILAKAGEKGIDFTADGATKLYFDNILEAETESGVLKATNAFTIAAEQNISAFTGADTNLVTGTAGTDTFTAVWNADGDLVDGSDPAGWILHSLADAVSDFLVASGDNTFVKKTLAETGAILEADLDHGNIQGLNDDDHSSYPLITNFEADRATIATNWTDLTDAGETALHSHAGSGDELVGVDDVATAGYLGVADNDGVLRTDNSIGYADGGDFITLSVAEAYVDHGGLGGLEDDDHTQYVLHTLADAANDFLVASGDDAFGKKTLAEVGALLEGDMDHSNLQNLDTGAAHSYIDQDVTSGATPIFAAIYAKAAEKGIDFTADGATKLYFDNILEAETESGVLKATNAFTIAAEQNIAAFTGADTNLVTGTAGTDTYTAVWNADGDIVDGSDPAGWILHSLADAANDFLVASGDNTFAKKTLAEVGALLEGDMDHANLQNLDTGADHSYIDQDVTATGTPAFAQVTIDDIVLNARTIVFSGAGQATLTCAGGQNIAIESVTFDNGVIGAFTAGGAIDFGSENMTNVDIDSGTIDGVTIFGTLTDKTGIDVKIVSGTEGDANDFAMWNGDGDVIGSGLNVAETGVLATAAEWTAQQNFNELAITSAGNAVAWNMDTGQCAYHNLTENTTISAPSNLNAGGTYILRVEGDGSSSLAFNAVFVWGEASAPAAPAADGDIIILSFYSDGTTLYGVEAVREEA